MALSCPTAARDTCLSDTSLSAIAANIAVDQGVAMSHPPPPNFSIAYENYIPYIRGISSLIVCRNHREQSTV